jgi:hypothetical protein
MDVTKLTDNQLADLAANLLSLLAGPEPLAMETHLRAELVAAFGTKPAEFAAQISAKAAADDNKKAATSTKNRTRAELLFLSSRTQDTLKAVAAPKSQFDLARLHFRKQRVGEYVALDPTDIAVVGYSNGVIAGRFRGNNRTQSVTYEIWRREGLQGKWRSHILTTKQKFKDESVMPGRYYEYRVRAVAAKNTSGFSNVAVVYGVL